MSDESKSGGVESSNALRETQEQEELKVGVVPKDRMFFSVTDLKGRILMGNSVFSKVSGYAEAELIGAPHNIIRHPSMPRGVFKLVWSTIQSGKHFFGYVINRAKNGKPYAVFTMVFPVSAGYLSMRTSAEVAPNRSAADGLYQAMLEAEKKVSAKGVPVSEVCTAGIEVFVKAFGNTYFGWADQALLSELEAHLPDYRALDTLYRNRCCASPERRQFFENLFSIRASCLGSLSETGLLGVEEKKLDSGLQTVSNSQRKLLTLSTNMALAASQLGHRGITLGVIAESFQDFAGEVKSSSVKLDTLKEKMAGGALNGIRSRLGIVTLISQMFLQFLAEMDHRSWKVLSEDQRFVLMIEVITEQMKSLTEESVRLRDNYRVLRQILEETELAVIALETVRQTGTVEAYRQDETQAAVGPYLETLRSLIQEMKDGISQCHDADQNLERGISTLRQQAQAIRVRAGSLRIGGDVQAQAA
jgi:PAS domain S-box-containing protein